MRLLLSTLAICTAATAGNAVEVKVSPIALNAESPDRRSVGRLIWRGGLELSSPDPRFGGLSALHVARDGQRMIALTDRGHWLTAALGYRGGDLKGVQDVTLSPLRGADGKPLSGRSGDSESLAIGDGMVVSFERRHRLSRYRVPSGGDPGLPVPLKAPQRLANLLDNGGIEAMTRLCDGRLLILAEKLVARKPGVEGWLQTAAGWARFRYRTTAGLRPTGATTLPDCRVALVERSFSIVAGLDIRITRMAVEDIRAETLVEPEVLANLSNPLTIDNFEGIASRRGEAGETLIYLVSDDNFSSIQKTLLVMFELVETP